MDDKLLESLLYRSEDPSVDYKSEQYVFSKNDVPDSGLSKPEKAKLLEDKKSELLKDILAMVNAWPDGPRYILLGFKENKPAPPTVVGIDPARLHDDAAFQQFIGSKVNAPLQFKYETQEFRGLPIGVFTIAKQRRPLYAKESYGVVEKNVVYVRRGSSTAIADPSEVAAMGAAENGHRADADVAVEIADKAGAALAGSSRTVRVPIFGPDPLPDFVEAPAPAGILGIQLPDIHGERPNSDYWRNLRGYVETRLRAIPVQIGLSNKSEFALTHCELHVSVKHGTHEVVLQEGDDNPKAPRPYRGIADFAANVKLFARGAKSSLEVSAVDGQHQAVATFDRVLPGRTVRAPELLSMLPAASGTVTVSCALFASELKEPRHFDVTFEVTATEEPWDIERLVELDSRLWKQK